MWNTTQVTALPKNNFSLQLIFLPVKSSLSFSSDGHARAHRRCKVSVIISYFHIKSRRISPTSLSQRITIEKASSSSAWETFPAVCFAPNKRHRLGASLDDPILMKFFSASFVSGVSTKTTSTWRRKLFISFGFALYARKFPSQIQVSSEARWPFKLI